MEAALNYTTAAMKLLQRWTAWDGDPEEQKVLRRESLDLMFEYTEPTRMKRNERSMRYYWRKKEREAAAR